MIAGPAARWRRLRRTDDGFSLNELMISMSIMSVVTVLSATGLLGMFRTADLTETAALTQRSLLASFSQLDRDVRYAARINEPYPLANGDFAVDYVAADDAGVPQCVRLTLLAADRTLTRMQWPQANATSTGFSPSTVALNVVSGNGTASPFQRTAGGTADSNYDRLAVQLKSTLGVSGAGATRAFDLQFTALNTVPSTTTLTCSQL